MPLHPDVPGLEATIIVDDQPLEEHDNRTPVAPNSVERYVVAESGATFEVHFQFFHPFPTDLPVSVLVTIDGKDLDEPLIRPEELYNADGHVSAGPISKSGKEFRKQKYRFAELVISEGVSSDEIESQKQKLEHTGIISLHFYNIQSSRLNNTFEGRERDIQHPGEVHEKALKGGALSHAVSLADPEPTGDLDFFDAEYTDNGEPFATFHFYYRSLKALKDLHIIKRTPEPMDLVECDDEIIQTSSPEQIRRMFAHWKRQEEVRQRLKRERSESVTVVGDNEILGGRSGSTVIGCDNVDDDVVLLRAVDLRRERRKRRKPTQDDEVIVLD